MQLCKCLNCFLKVHNKQLNQYCLNFIIFLPKKKKVLKNGSSSGQIGLGWPAKTRVGSWVNPFLFQVKNLNLGQVFFGMGQKILIRFAMSTCSIFDLYGSICSLMSLIAITPSVPLCLSFILFWDVPKYCPVSKNKSH